MEYKKWSVEKNEVGHYEAIKLDGSSEYYLHAKTLKGIMTEIDNNN